MLIMTFSQLHLKEGKQMKKTISLLLALVMCLSLCACGNNTSTNDANPINTEEEENNAVVLLMSQTLANSLTFNCLLL